MKYLLVLSVWFLTATAAAEETLVQFGSPMVYLANRADPGIGLTWTEFDFDASSWPAGNYGVGFETTTNAKQLLLTQMVKGVYSIYTRTTFEVADPAEVKNLYFGADYDDGYVVWLNGVEVLRSSQMPTTGPEWNTPTTRGHECSGGPSPNYGTLKNISAKALPALRAGVNVLAIGVWNAEPGSSDLVLVPKLLRDLVSLTRGPYLQMGSPTGLTVRWRTDVPTNSRVRWGLAPASLFGVNDDSRLVTEHAVSVKPLQPDTRYYYSIGSTTRALAKGTDYYFITPPPAGTPRPLRIWALGDSGTTGTNARSVRDAYYAFNGDRHTDLWLMLGDNAYSDGTDTQYQKAVFNMYPKTLRSSVLWPTLGNHDGRSADSATLSGPYYDIFTLPRNAEAGGIASGTEAYYSFDFSNVHFICLESYETDRSPGGAMLTWLREDLAATSQTWIIAFWHHPPYTKGSHNSDRESQLIQMRQNALPILEEGGVDLVLCGHSHSYERSFLLDRHYGLSTTLSQSNLVDAGDGREDSSGAYRKPTAGPAPHEGAVYVVAGSSGKISGGDLNHPAMFVSLNVMGSLVLDLDRERLDLLFLDNLGARRDYFTLLKGDAAKPSGLVDRVALAEAPAEGTVSGSLLNTRSADGVYQTIEEVDSPAPNNTRIHSLDHQWTVDVKPGNAVTFFLKAYRSQALEGENFAFAWSADGQTYQDLLTVTWTGDHGVYQTAALPPTLSGPVYLRARNTNRSPQPLARALNRLFVDHLFIRTE